MRTYEPLRNTLIAGLLVVGLLNIMACSEEPGVAEEAESPDLQLHGSTLTLGSPIVASKLDSSSASDLRELRRTNPEEFFALRKIRTIAMSAATWKEADQAVRTELEEASPMPQDLREQMAAAVMLDGWLLGGEDGEEKQEAVAYYTQLLVENDVPNPVLMLRSLQKLRGYWSAQRIAESARSTVETVEAFEQDQSARESARKVKNLQEGLGAAKSNSGLKEQFQRQHYEREQALDELRRMGRG